MSFGFGVGDFVAVLKVAQSVRGKWIDAPVEYASIKNEVKNIENILSDLNELNTQIELTAQEKQSLEDVSSSCVPVLETCNRIVDKYAANSAPGSRNRMRRSWKRFKLDPDDIRHARDQLSSLIAQLTAIEGAIQLRVSNDMQEAVDDLQQNDKRYEHEHIADWYASASFAVQYNEYARTRQKGTGTWFLQNDRYIRWRNQQDTASHRTLLCPGIPGSGKTIMATAIIDDLRTFLEHEEDSVVGYFYCNFKRREEQELHQLYASIIRQLFQEQGCLPESVNDLYVKHYRRKTRPSIDELEALLRLLVKQHQRVYIVIDALDECNTDDSTRVKLLNKLFDLQNVFSHVSLLVTTRFIPDIIQSFTACETLEVRATTEDIESYLNNRMNELASFVRRRSDLQQEIKSQIVKLVDGMFLLARLHFESLIGYTNATKLRETLGRLPSGKDALNRAYDSARERIEHQPKPKAELARQALKWVVYAKRELFMAELQEAIAIGTMPEKTAIDCENDLDESDEILSACAGLLVLGESDQVRLVHYTTQGYIESVQGEWLPNAHIDIARDCIAYLNLDTFDLKELVWKIKLDDYFLHNKLLSYMSDYWGYHIRDTDDVDVQDQAIRFLYDEKKLCFVSQVTKAHKEFLPRMCFVRDSTPMHMCAHFDMAAICSNLIAIGMAYECADSEGRTPFNLAASRNSLNMLQLLLNIQGIDIDKMPVYGGTALYEASWQGRARVVEILLGHPDVDVNRPSTSGRLALLSASHAGEVEVVELLLGHPCIDVNARDVEGSTALIHTAITDKIDVARILLRHPGIDVNIQNNRGETALFIACRELDTEVVQLLLQRPEFDANYQDYYENAELLQAVNHGSAKAVNLSPRLLDINVNIPNNQGETALLIACQEEHTEAVQALLRHPNININQQYQDGLTALIVAACKGDSETVEVLLDHHDIKINICDRYGWTALRHAVSSEHILVVEALLNHPDIDINKADESKTTALVAAISSAYDGDQDIVEQLLLHPGIDVNVQDEFGNTALKYAVARGRMKIVKLLLRRFQIDINARMKHS